MAVEISESPPYPEVIGDRKFIRFLRGNGHNIDKVCELIQKFLQWRKDNGVNEMRREIVEEGLNHPSKFPNGPVIIASIPQIVIAPTALDKKGAPVVLEQYNFSVSEVLAKITIPQYIRYVIFSLEFRSLVLEQLSEERELAYLNSLSPEERSKVDEIDCESEGVVNIPYGVIVNICVIRDLCM